MQTHRLTCSEHREYQCQACGLSWAQRPDRFAPCLGVPIYASWAEVPEGLKTRTALIGAGLRPGALPAGCCYEQRGKKCLFYWLYDERLARPRRMLTNPQRQALAAAREARRQRHTCARCGGWVRDASALNALHRCGGCERRVARRNVMIRWAREVLADPLAAVLDSETTDLTGFPISLAVVRVDGTVLFDRLINPEAPISLEAHRVHGLRDTDVAEAPTLAAHWPELEPVLRSHHLIAYNASFDQGRLHASALRYGLDGWLPMDDLMQKYADYRHTGWWKLEQAARSEGITPGRHQALGDCLAALGLIRVMAGQEVLPEVEEAEPALALEEIPF